MRDESFGPVIGIQAVDVGRRGGAAMNDTEYGLTAASTPTSRARAQASCGRSRRLGLLELLRPRRRPRLPWTGRGHSGVGSTLSTTASRFLQPKAWHLRAPADRQRGNCLSPTEPVRGAEQQALTGGEMNRRLAVGSAEFVQRQLGAGAGDHPVVVEDDDAASDQAREEELARGGHRGVDVDVDVHEAETINL